MNVRGNLVHSITSIPFEVYFIMSGTFIYQVKLVCDRQNCFPSRRGVEDKSMPCKPEVAGSILGFSVNPPPQTLSVEPGIN